MMPYEDIHFQLVDLPPISNDYFEPWVVNSLQTADAAFLVIDISNPECIDHIDQVITQLDQRKVNLTDQFETELENGVNTQDDPEFDPFRVALPTILIANKIDLASDPDELDALNELVNYNFPSIALSALTGTNLELFPQMVFEKLKSCGCTQRFQVSLGH